MPKRAFSYIRFSREHQNQGDSLRRQLEATRSYCERNNLALDESLNLRDLGVSAFKGRNAEHGALGRFIDLAQRGEIPEGSALVVESLDRISRQSPRRTVVLLSSLLDLGIEVHLTMAGKVFKPSKAGQDSGSQEAMDLFLAVAMAMRAHEESETKSRRLREAFARKRERAAAGEVHVSKTLPWWLTFENEKIVAVPERATVVKRIFSLTAKGWSSQRIARKLNEEGLPTWRPRAREWQDSRIRDTIRYDAALGHLTPTSKTKAAGLDYRIQNYYPRIISDLVAAEARAAMKENLVGHVDHQSASGRPLNLFRGLLRHKGRWCRFQSHRNGIPGPDGVKAWNSYYDDHDPNQGGKKSWSIAARQLEPVVVHGLKELSPEDLLPSEPRTPRRSTHLRRKINSLEAKIRNLVTAMEGGSRAVANRLGELEQELLEARQELAKADAEEGRRPSTTHHLKSISVDLNDGATRMRTLTAIRRLVDRIDVGRELTDLPQAPDFPSLLAPNKTGIFAKGPYVHMLADPVPKNKRRRPLFIFVRFRTGAGRLIFRKGIENKIVSLRWEPSSGTSGGPNHARP